MVNARCCRRCRRRCRPGRSVDRSILSNRSVAQAGYKSIAAACHAAPLRVQSRQLGKAARIDGTSGQPVARTHPERPHRPPGLSARLTGPQRRPGSRVGRHADLWLRGLDPGTDAYPFFVSSSGLSHYREAAKKTLFTAPRGRITAPRGCVTAPRGCVTPVPGEQGGVGGTCRRGCRCAVTPC